MQYLYSVADYPIYWNGKKQVYEVYTSTSINGKLLAECKDQESASQFAIERYNEIYN